MTQCKELIFEEEARFKLRDGLVKVVDVAQVTLGPRGRHIGLEESYGAPVITSDGHTIVKNLELRDQFLNMGASIAKEAAAQMKVTCGDGTTTTLLLLKSLVEHGLKNIHTNSSPIELKREMEQAVEIILKELDKLSKPIQKIEEILPIAISSASGDVEVGKRISTALQNVGFSGVVTIEEGKGVETTLEMTQGLQFDRGYMSPYFCTHVDSQTVELHDAAVLITDMKIGSIQEVIALVQDVAHTGRALLIIADDVQEDALSTFVINKIRGTLKVCVVKAPSFGDDRRSQLQDMAMLTGGTLITEDVGLLLSNATVDLLGSAQKIIVTKDKTTIIGGARDTIGIQERVRLLDAQIVQNKSHNLIKRRAQLTGGVAVIRVGATTEPEMKQKKQLYEDSLHSTQAAIEEGVVPGGGVALLRAASALKEHPTSLGAKIVVQACAAPFRQIVQNGGLDSSLYFEQVLSKETNFGFNAVTQQVEDLIVSGVIDPTKIVKHSLKIALSAAGTLLLSEVLIGHTPDNK